MEEEMSVVDINPDLDAQRRYAKRMVAEGYDFGLTHGEAFVRGIRDLGYKSTATAIDELIDNSEQAGAQQVHVFFDDFGRDPTWLAVADDGHGMVPEMIRLAVIWGGTHRENDRKGFGRYGWGLPSASVSIGRRFTVYSWTSGLDSCQMVTVDLDDIAEGRYNEDGRIVIPAARPAQLPEDLRLYLEDLNFSADHGTLVLIETIDRLTWRNPATLKTNLLEHFGVIYRNYLRNIRMTVQGTRVEVVDPLFLTPGARYYDLDDERPEELEPIRIDVRDKETKEPKGTITVRFSYMPYTFLRPDKPKPGSRANKNKRQDIRIDNNGLIILRNGRQIDVITRKHPYINFLTDDRTIGVEVNFPPTLDEEFSITTSKQQVVLTDRMWNILQENDVFKAIRSMRKQYDTDKAAWQGRFAAREDSGEGRASEQAMTEASKYKTQPPGGDAEDRRRKAAERMRQLAAKRAEETGKSVEEALRELEAEAQGRPYVVKEEEMPGAPFYRMEQIGGMKVLYLNRAHNFYKDMYAQIAVQASDNPSALRLRSALEVLLFVLGDCELDANDERQVFYANERYEWSRRLETTLTVLQRTTPVAEMSKSEREDEGPEAA
jgi:Histidine kinase-, DNA gyrase B-, and HSP90-like ATPase